MLKLIKILKKSFIIFASLILFVYCESHDAEKEDNPNLYQNWEISSYELVDSCASDFSVSYSIFEKDNNIFIGYYDAHHQLSIAKREPNGKWSYAKLEEFVDYDSHKYIELILDKDGIVHLCANMHASPLVYYKGLRPYSIDCLIKQPMVGTNETDSTYPQFMIEPNKLIFHYRSGISGNGTEIFNEYNYNTKTWERRLDKPLFDGEGLCNAYFVGPILGLDNNYHIVWCWRDTGDCITNHGLYYAFSQDLKHWYSTDGMLKEIPIIPTDNQFIVDDIPPKKGLLNCGFTLGFDNKQNPLIAYHKYDENDKTNIFVAKKPENNNTSWSKIKLTDWNWKWEFSGYGTIILELYIPKVWGMGDNIYCSYNKYDTPSQLICYNQKTGISTITEYQEYPKSIQTKLLENSEIVQIIFDKHSLNTKTKYLIRYETLNENRDYKTDKHILPSPLFLYKLISYNK